MDALTLAVLVEQKKEAFLLVESNFGTCTIHAACVSRYYKGQHLKYAELMRTVQSPGRITCIWCGGTRWTR